MKVMTETKYRFVVSRIIVIGVFLTVIFLSLFSRAHQSYFEAQEAAVDRRVESGVLNRTLSDREVDAMIKRLHREREFFGNLAATPLFFGIFGTGFAFFYYRKRNLSVRGLKVIREENLRRRAFAFRIPSLPEEFSLSAMER